MLIKEADQEQLRELDRALREIISARMVPPLSYKALSIFGALMNTTSLVMQTIVDQARIASSDMTDWDEEEMRRDIATMFLDVIMHPYDKEI